MNYVLVIMMAAGRLWTPVYVTVYPTEQQCLQAKAAKSSEDGFSGWTATRSAHCVPEVKAK